MPTFPCTAEVGTLNERYALKPHHHEPRRPPNGIKLNSSVVVIQAIAMVI